MSKFLRYEGNALVPSERPVVREAAVTLFLNGQQLGTTMVTPERLEDFARGFLVLERIVENASITEIRVDGHDVRVASRASVAPPAMKIRTSALNVSGGAGLPPPLPMTTRLRPVEVLALMKTLNTHAEQYRQSGGVHTSALRVAGGFFVAADVGRHNTIDKIVGHCLASEVDLTQAVLVSSGRITLETVHKAWRIACEIVISRTSPTDAAIALAERGNLTLVGYARGGAFNVYARPERIAAVDLEANSRSSTSGALA